MTREEIENALNVQYGIIMESQSYLADTDYESIREAEGGKPMDEDVRTARAEARVIIDNARVEISRLKELEPEEPEHPEHDMHIEPEMKA